MKYIATKITQQSIVHHLIASKGATVKITTIDRKRQLILYYVFGQIKF